MAGQTPAGGHTGAAGFKEVGGLGDADRGHGLTEAGWAGQLDESDVVVDGVGVPAGVGEHLQERDE